MAIAKSDANSPIKSIDDFSKLHNKSYIVPQKIKAAVKKLADRKGWCYEVDFLKLAGVTAIELGTFREPFLEDHVVIIKDSRRAWAGTKAIANELRAML